MTPPQRTFETRSAELERVSDALWRRLVEGRAVSDPELEALAEASFRVGVHRATEPGRALELLARARRIEPSNPKHAYHIGRIFLEHGAIGEAEAWLAHAASLAPTSHRIWVHLSLALRVRDERERGRPGYKGEHRERAEAIAAAVREGRDDVEDEGAPKPLLRQGECRWSGVRDLDVEVGLRRKTSARRRDELADDLEWLAETAASRRGGAARFAVLAVQWMVYGYPPAAIRRLAKRLPESEPQALSMLGTVCELFEASEEALPGRLAECLERDELPDIVVALIHQRRLFSRPLRFPDPGAHLGARAFNGGDAEAHVKAMGRAVEQLAERRPAALADSVREEGAPGGSEAASPSAWLEELERRAASLGVVVDGAKALCKALGGIADPVSEAARLEGDLGALTDIAARVKAVCAESLSGLRGFKKAEAAGQDQPSDEFRVRVEECEAAFQNANIPPALLKKATRRLKQAKAGAGPVAPVRSEGAVGLLDMANALTGEPGPTSPEPTDATVRLTREEPVDAGEPSGATIRLPRPDSRAVAEPLQDDAVSQVRAAVAAAERALDGNYAAAYRTIEVYPARLHDRLAVSLLRGYLDGHRAESDYRSGRSTTARRHWQRMLGDDPFHAAVLRNLAVAHASSGDVGQAGHAWGRYLEALYVHDVLAGDLRRGAAHRAAVHRVLSGAFGTASLYPGFARDDDAPLRHLPLVLAGGAGTAAAVGHLRLEELNHVLSRRSPTALLGVSRSVTDDQLAAARDSRIGLIEAACAELPERVRGVFTGMCRQTVEEAYERASDVSTRIRRSDDEEDAEEERCLAWAQERVRWKYSIRKALFGTDAAWVDCEHSGDVIGGLALLDGLPLEASDDFTLRAARRFGDHAKPEEFIDLLNKAAPQAREYGIGRIIAIARDPSIAAPGFLERFPKVHRSWVRNELPERYLGVFDDPKELYLHEVRTAVELLGKEDLGGEDLRVLESAEVVLRRWDGALPGSTGPARVLARVLARLGRSGEAGRVLDDAASESLADTGRLAVSFTRIGIDIDLGAYRQAVAAIRRLIDDGVESRELAVLLLNAYGGWLQGGSGPAPEEIDEILARWEDPEITRHRYRLVARAVMNALPEAPSPEQVPPVLRRLRFYTERHANGTDAPYYGAVLSYQLARLYREHMQKASGASRRELKAKLGDAKVSCGDFARELMKRNPSDHQRTEIERFLGRLGLTSG